MGNRVKGKWLANVASHCCRALYWDVHSVGSVGRGGEEREPYTFGGCERTCKGPVVLYKTRWYSMGVVKVFYRQSVNPFLTLYV